MRLKSIFVLVTLFSFSNAFADKINDLLNSHYQSYKNKEYFSGIALAVYLPHQAIKNYYIGTEGHGSDNKRIDANTLFEIGSITKSFTAAILLQLEKEKKLHLSDTLQTWLPEYNHWSFLTVRSLLNMTSGLPNYSDAPLMNAEQFQQPARQWSNQELINFVYPMHVSPPLKTGYFYSNTGYILSSLIIEKITQQNLQAEIAQRLIEPAKLDNTYYPLPTLNDEVYARLAHGYNYNQYTNPELVGQDIKSHSLSWAGGAGAIISNASDIIKWVNALFVGDKILDQHQKQELMQLVSTTTGKPILQTSATDSRAFALGVSQGFDNTMGIYWFYEGETEGFRALYMYVPSNGIIIASIFNSAVNEENDHAGELMKKVYAEALHLLSS